MRKFIRHPSGMPIRCRLAGDMPARKERLKDVGEGGLCFSAHIALEPGYIVHLDIPIADQSFEADAEVVWCHPDQDSFDVGVRFENQSDQFAARMIEQICYIEQYRQQIKQEEGRDLSSEEAAEEWIARFASDFPMMQ